MNQSNRSKDQIKLYQRCQSCQADLDTWTVDPNGDTSPREYGRVEIGYTDDGIQAWCIRHEISIVHIQLKGDEKATTKVGGSISISDKYSVNDVKQHLKLGE